MPKPIIIYSKEDQDAAAAFRQFSDGITLESSQAFSPRRKSNVGSFIAEECLPIFYMGHTDAEHNRIDDLTPEQFAEQFASGVSLDKRKKIHDLYLISSESGLLPYPSVATQLYWTLIQQGFTNIKVHAVSSEPVPDAKGMVVEVITDPGYSSKPVGSVQAYTYTPDDAGKERKKIDSALRASLSAPLKKRDKRGITSLRAKIINMEKAGKPGIRSLLTNTTYDELMMQLNDPINTFQTPEPLVEEPNRLVKAIGWCYSLFSSNSPRPQLDTKESTYKMNLNKVQVISSFNTMYSKLVSLELDYDKASEAYKVVDRLVIALNPIKDLADRYRYVGNEFIPVALGESQFQELEEALNEAKRVLPKHRGFFDQIFSAVAKFLGLGYRKTDSAKKLAAVTEVLDEEMENAKKRGPST